MQDIQLIRLLDVLRVNSIRNATGISPRSIVVGGEDFHDVEEVLINAIQSPQFTVFSKTELVAQVPDDLVDGIISDVAVLSASLTFTDRSLVEFTAGIRPRTVSGILRLMQNFLRLLLRGQGTNIFHPRSGGSMIKRIGANISSSAAADISIAVSATKQYMINVQTQDRNIPPSERLLSADIQALTVDPASTSIFVTIALTSHSGQTAAATLST